MKHIALLGDSVFDNKAYVGGGPDVVEQLRMILPAMWNATLCAVDGAVVKDVRRQLKNVPSDATHLVISIGGNDALGESSVLEAPAGSVAEALQRLAAISERFHETYRQMLDHLIAARRLPTAVCTIYDPRYPDFIRRKLGALALSVINDSITREAFARGLDLLDLRVIFSDERDFANPIEPSVQGGMKLAIGILRFAEGANGLSRVIV